MCVCVCVCVCVCMRVRVRVCAYIQQVNRKFNNIPTRLNLSCGLHHLSHAGRWCAHDSTCQGSNYFLFPILYCKSQVANWPLSRPLAFQTSSPWYHFMILLNTHFLKSETTHQYRLVHAAVIVAHGNTDNVVSCGHLPAK